jgi:hypothetical protein
MLAGAEGLPGMRFVEYPPPNIATEGYEAIYEKAKLLVDKMIRAFTEPAPVTTTASTKIAEAKTGKTVFSGSFEEVNEFFRKRQWTDGLPIVPPTLEAVDAMMRFTDRSSDELLPALPPASYEATVWTLAINGVMAGCRPEYMPVLLAAIEAIGDTRFGLQHAGSTAGWTPFIILNGPIIKELDFNSGQGVLRPERQANITVARFLRLAMVNMAGYRLGTTDMATFGSNYMPVLAEAEDESPYEPLSVDLGFHRGANVITVLSALSMSYHFPSTGKTAEDQLRVITSVAKRELGSFVRIVTIFGPEVSPVLCLSPLVASIIAEAGYSKDDIRQYIYDNARIPAYEFDENLGLLWPGYTVHQAVEQGKLPPSFCATEDPARMLPVLRSPRQLLIVVSGSSTKNRNFIVNQAGDQGLAVSKEIKLPSNWGQRSNKNSTRKYGPRR